MLSNALANFHSVLFLCQSHEVLALFQFNFAQARVEFVAAVLGVQPFFVCVVAIEGNAFQGFARSITSVEKWLGYIKKIWVYICCRENAPSTTQVSCFFRHVNRVAVRRASFGWNQSPLLSLHVLSHCLVKRIVLLTYWSRKERSVACFLRVELPAVIFYFVWE